MYGGNVLSTCHDCHQLNELIMSLNGNKLHVITRDGLFSEESPFPLANTVVVITVSCKRLYQSANPAVLPMTDV